MAASHFSDAEKTLMEMELAVVSDSVCKEVTELMGTSDDPDDEIEVGDMVKLLAQLMDVHESYVLLIIVPVFTLSASKLLHVRMNQMWLEAIANWILAIGRSTTNKSKTVGVAELVAIRGNRMFGVVPNAAVGVAGGPGGISESRKPQICIFQK